jgi:hypothetical protein
MVWKETTRTTRKRQARSIQGIHKETTKTAPAQKIRISRLARKKESRIDEKDIKKRIS